MKRKIFLIIIFFSIFMLSSMPTQVRAADTIMGTINDDVNPGQYRVLSWTSASPFPKGFYVDFSISTVVGSGVYVEVMDDPNLVLKSQSQPYDTLFDFGYSTGDSFSMLFGVAYEPVYVVFTNNEASVQHVTGAVYLDLTSPIITVDPTNGTVVSGIVSINMTAIDAHFLNSWMDIRIDGVSVASNALQTELSFLWDTTSYSEGDHTILLRANDQAQNLASKTVVYTVDQTPTTTTNTPTTTTNTPTTTESSSSTTPTPSPTQNDNTMILVLGALGGVGAVAAAAGLVASRRRRSSLDAKVLVICPFCGAKNEQGITTCRKCGAEI